MFCKYKPKEVTRTVLKLARNDCLYWIIEILFGFSQGYLSSLAMMHESKPVKSEEEPTAEKFCRAYLITGIIVAICFSFVWPHIVK